MEKLEFGSGKSFAIGPITVEPSQNILRHGTNISALEPKIMDVLEYLAAHQGKVCSRDAIIAAIWKVEFGADESLTRAISVIRKTFRKAGGRGAYIQTISKRGYILQETVSEITAASPKQTTLAAAPEAITPKTVRPEPAMPDVVMPKAVIPEVVISETKPAPHHIELPPSEINAPVPARKTRSKTLAVIIVGGLIASGITLASQPWRSAQSFGGELTLSPYGRSVAVMPFVDLSKGKDHQYFSDGIAEELSNELGKIESLRIVGLKAGRAAEYQTQTYEAMGTDLKVSHIIHGSVRRQGDQVRVTAQLINTEDNSHAWSSNYDGNEDDLFELQQRVASEVVTELYLLLSLEFVDPVDIEGYSPSAYVSDSK